MTRSHGAALLTCACMAAVGAPAAGTEAARAPSSATVDVAVATLWKQPGIARPIDAPSLANPVDPTAWNKNLSTTESRRWLVGRVVTQALYGETVRVLTRRGAWARVAVVGQPTPLDRRGYPGWLPVRQLAPAGTFGTRGPSVVVTAPTATLHVRGRTLELSYGTRLPLVRRVGALAIVRTPDGQGRLAAAPPPARPSPRSIVAAARRFVGVRYLWGGTSAWGFDCSGLTWSLFAAQGVTIPRDAEPQFRQGEAVATGKLRPGDLLFYGSGTSVHHVAIYAGAGRMIEAPDSAHSVRRVPVRWAGLAGARRFIH